MAGGAQTFAAGFGGGQLDIGARNAVAVRAAGTGGTLGVETGPGMVAMRSDGGDRAELSTAPPCGALPGSARDRRRAAHVSVRRRVGVLITVLVAATATLWVTWWALGGADDGGVPWPVWLTAFWFVLAAYMVRAITAGASGDDDASDERAGDGRG